MKNSKIMIMLKGMIVGGTMMVPGVSGGSMAMILGVYDKLISSVSSFFKDKLASFIFLALFALGGGVGILLFAKPLSVLIDKYPMPTLYFFMGAVVGSIPMIFNKAEIKRFSYKVPLYIFVGVAIVFALGLIPDNNVQLDMDIGFTSSILLGLAGFVAAVALVLPGISVSFLLLVMGLYNTTINAISDFYLPFLIPLGIGLVLGIVLTTKVLEQAMNNYPQITYMIILGFLLGSVPQLFPGIPSIKETIICVITLAVGYGIIRTISARERSVV